MVNIDYKTLIGPAAQDMQAVDRLIEASLRSDVPTISQLANYIVGSGGKRLRPVTVVLSARACGYGGTAHHQLAAIIEFIHTATLLHDDVVDESLLRRGRQTVNSRWGNNLSVLVGDFLYSRAFEMMVDIGDMRIMNILAHATNVIAEGEVLQTLSRRNPDIGEADYLRIVESKTATLFSAATQLAGMVAGHSEQAAAPLADYGRSLGTAYQLIDDVLDLKGEVNELGKNLGDDLAQGQPTLPLIYALAHADPDTRDLITEAILKGGVNDLAPVTKAIESTHAIAYTARLAQSYAADAKRAICKLPDTSFKGSLIALADFSVQRNF